MWMTLHPLALIKYETKILLQNIQGFDNLINVPKSSFPIFVSIFLKETITVFSRTWSQACATRV